MHYGLTLWGRGHNKKHTEHCHNTSTDINMLYQTTYMEQKQTDCSHLAVACLTAVREVLGSNRAVGSGVYRKNYHDLQPCARAVRTLPAVPRSTQPSTLRGPVNEYQLSGSAIIINGDGGCRR